jgi:drug/metabolite transporter superfamily protein YnfA
MKVKRGGVAACRPPAAPQLSQDSRWAEVKGLEGMPRAVRPRCTLPVGPSPRDHGMIFVRLTRGIGFALLAIIVLLVGAWCSVAVWYRCGASEPLRAILAAATLVLALVTTAFLATPHRWRALAVYVGCFILFLAWWAMITPTNDRNWAADVARSVTANIDGNRLVINNVRNFTWRSDADFDPRWEQRNYDLSRVTDVDLIMSYWAGEAIAHTIVSFGFADGVRVAFSVETRKDRGEAYSSLAGFFKQYELAIVAADERDVVRVRSNVRGEDVRIYRLRITPANAQLLLREYVEEANDIAQTPQFYNTLTANCTTLVFKMVRVIHPGLPLDARILLSGYLPNYVYDLGATDTSVPFEELRKLSKIRDRALRADADANFSARIREGILTPR